MYNHFLVRILSSLVSDIYSLYLRTMRNRLLESPCTFDISFCCITVSPITTSGEFSITTNHITRIIS